MPARSDLGGVLPGLRALVLALSGCPRFPQSQIALLVHVEPLRPFTP